jgi:GH25 family lysozyme M1 (1,4-beta-N-acetylmuramidase)
VFARPDDPDALGQADFLVDTMQWATDGQTMPPMVDLEWPYFEAPMCYGLTPPEMVAWISEFVERVEARIGRPPTIYTNVHWWNPCTANSSDFARYPLDVSSCDLDPPQLPGWGHGWTFWQHDIPDCGLGSTRDSDVFHGTYEELAAFTASPAHHVTGSTRSDRDRAGRKPRR